MVGGHRRDVVLERAKELGVRLPCDHPAAASSGDGREHHGVANMRPDVEHRITRSNQARERFRDGEVVDTSRVDAPPDRRARVGHDGDAPRRLHLPLRAAGSYRCTLEPSRELPWPPYLPRLGQAVQDHERSLPSVS